MFSPDPQTPHWLIGGKPVPRETWPQIVLLTTDAGTCTATVIGSRAILTAAHCVHTDGEHGTFKVGGKDYDATFERSPFYVGQNVGWDHDIAVGVTRFEIQGTLPMAVGGLSESGMTVRMFGYGCANPNDPLDYVLRSGENRVRRVQQRRMEITGQVDGAAGCYGDSGGPSLAQTDQGMVVLGVHSQANIKDLTWDIRMDQQDSFDFLKRVADQNQVEICGITKSQCSRIQGN